MSLSLPDPRRLHNEGERGLRNGGDQRQIRNSDDREWRADVPATCCRRKCEQFAETEGDRPVRVVGRDHEVRRSGQKARHGAAVEEEWHENPHDDAADRRQSRGEVHPTGELLTDAAEGHLEAEATHRLRAGRRGRSRSLDVHQRVLRPLRSVWRRAEAESGPIPGYTERRAAAGNAIERFPLQSRRIR